MDWIQFVFDKWPVSSTASTLLLALHVCYLKGLIVPGWIHKSNEKRCEERCRRIIEQRDMLLRMLLRNLDISDKAVSNNEKLLHAIVPDDDDDDQRERGRADRPGGD